MGQKGKISNGVDNFTENPYNIVVQDFAFTSLVVEVVPLNPELKAGQLGERQRVYRLLDWY